MRPRPTIPHLRSALAVLACTLAAGSATAADAGRADTRDRADFTFACPDPRSCRPQAGPGPADRQVHPFAGSLGRPCAYRWRATPSGTRKVRVCF